jgi:hypothetical protein
VGDAHFGRFQMGVTTNTAATFVLSPDKKRNTQKAEVESRRYEKTDNKNTCTCTEERNEFFFSRVGTVWTHSEQGTGHPGHRVKLTTQLLVCGVVAVNDAVAMFFFVNAFIGIALELVLPAH